MAIPAPRLAITAWLLAPNEGLGAEARDELRQSLARRLPALIASAAVTSLIAILAVSRHPIPALFWTLPDLALALVRIPLVLHIMRSVGRTERGRALDPWMVDLFVGAGTLWSALLGLGTLLCLATNDPGLSILVVLMAMGTIGAQGVRSPGSPRLNILQMCLIIVPTGAGTLISTIPLTSWAAVFCPLYLFGMINVTRRLHDDYAEMIVARIENWRRAMHCPLTGLANRPHLDAVLAQVIAQARVSNAPITLLCLDLDGFKAVNDALGHPVGDRLLGQVADRLRQLLGPIAPARIGGDEFAIVLSGCGAAEAEAIAGRLIDAVARPYDLGTDSPTRIGVSVGIAVGDGTTDAATLVERADEALYDAKRAGRGIFRRYGADGEPADPSSGLERRALTERMPGPQEAAGVAA